MFSAYLKITSKLITDRYNDETATVVVPIGATIKGVVPDPIANVIDILSKIELEINAISFVVHDGDKKLSVIAKVITNTNLD